MFGGKTTTVSVTNPGFIDLVVNKKADAIRVPA